MPLSALQRRVLAAIAAQRDPESYVAGGTAPHRHGTRGSADIGLFHDGEAALDRHNFHDRGGEENPTATSCARN